MAEWDESTTCREIKDLKTIGIRDACDKKK